MELQSQPADSGEDAQKRAEERNTVRYWLANEDIYTSAYVRKWLERTPPDEAADTLALIAQTARPDPHSLLWMMFHAMTAMLTTAEIISDNSPAGRKAGIRAAILLADRKDPRALPPLARVIETHWFWQGKYQDAIEAALLNLLSRAPEGIDWTPYHVDLHTLINAIRKRGGGRQELSARQADLLIAALQCLATAADSDSKALLQTVASSDAHSPQRLRVKEEARTISSSR